MWPVHVTNPVQGFSSLCLSIPSVCESVHTFASHKLLSQLKNPQPFLICVYALHHPHQICSIDACTSWRNFIWQTKHARHRGSYWWDKHSSHSSLISWSQRWQWGAGLFNPVLLHTGTVITSSLVELLDVLKLHSESTSSLWVGAQRVDSTSIVLWWCATATSTVVYFKQSIAF